MPRIEDVGSNSLKRGARPTQGCKLDYDYDLVKRHEFRENFIEHKMSVFYFISELFTLNEFGELLSQKRTHYNKKDS
jgi:hypothetical protein